MDLLSVAVAAKLTREEAGSALPGAPVVAVRQRKVTLRRLLARVRGRRTVARTNQED